LVYRPVVCNQFGGNIGGYIPIPKISPRSNKKAFFFFNYEGTRANRPNGNPGGAGSTFYTMPQPSMLGIGTPNGEADLSPVYRPGNMCDFNGGATCNPIHDTNGNLVQNGQVFVPGTGSMIPSERCRPARHMWGTLSPRRSSTASTRR
jgi:hypothetical protein